MDHAYDAQFYELIIFVLFFIIVCSIKDGKEDEESKNKTDEHEFIGPCPHCDPEKDRCCY